MTFSMMPSRLSRTLTQIQCRLRLGYAGKGTDVQPQAQFEYPRNIAIGDGVCVGHQAVLRANSKCTPGIAIGHNSHVGEFSVVAANRGKVVIGANSWIGPHCVLHGNGGLRVGDNVMIASHCAISTVAHQHDRLDIPMSEQGVHCEPVIIEDDVWIGTGAVILKGVRIGRGSIVGAGAVVTRDLPPHSIAMGVPARVTGYRNAGQSDNVVHNVHFARKA